MIDRYLLSSLSLLLFLHHSCLSVLSSEEICQLPDLLTIACSCDLQSGGLQIQCDGLNSTKGFTSVPPQVSKRVTRLVITGGSVSCLNLNHLSGLTHLKDLSITKSRISQAPCAGIKTSTGTLKYLHSLDLSNNRLRKLGDNLSVLVKLTYLNLSNNKLVELNEAALSGFTNLRSLDISNNKLSSSLDQNSMESLSGGIKYLDMTGNPFICSPSLSWLYSWSTSLPIVVQQQLASVECTVENSPTDQHSPLLMVMQYYSNRVNPDCPTPCSCHFYHFVDTTDVDSESPDAEYTLLVNCTQSNMFRFPSLPVQTTLLDMSHNNLTQESFTNLNIIEQNYKDLSGLILSHNQLTSIDSKLLKLRLQRSFKADHNQLTEIPYDFSLLLQKYDNHQITLGDNPWICSCNSEINDRSLLDKIQDVYSIECSAGSKPESIVDKMVLDVESVVLCPISHEIEDKELMLRVLCVCLTLLILVLITKLLYDYCQYRNKGKLPWIVYKMP